MSAWRRARRGLLVVAGDGAAALLGLVIGLTLLVGGGELWTVLRG